MKKILISLFILGLCGLPVVFCGGGGSTPGGETGNPFIGTWDADTYDYTLIFTYDLYTGQHRSTGINSQQGPYTYTGTEITITIAQRWDTGTSSWYSVPPEPSTSQYSIAGSTLTLTTDDGTYTYTKRGGASDDDDDTSLGGCMGAADPDETKCTFSTYVEYTQLTGVTAQEMCTASGTTYIDSAPETDPTFGYPVRIICTYPTMKFYHYDTPCGSEDGCGYASYATLVEGCEAGGGTASEEFPDIE